LVRVGTTNNGLDRHNVVWFLPVQQKLVRAGTTNNCTKEQGNRKYQISDDSQGKTIKTLKPVNMLMFLAPQTILDGGIKFDLQIVISTDLLSHET